MGKITASKTTLRPDPRHNSLLVAKFVNCLMYDGKKTVAYGVIYDAFDEIAEKIKDRPAVEVFEQAIENVKPYIEVRSKRVGGASYQVPMQVNKNRQQSLARSWTSQCDPSPSQMGFDLQVLRSTAHADSGTGC